MRRRFAITLIAPVFLVLGLAGFSFVQAQSTDEPARLVGSFKWRLTETWFGGFSAIEVSDDGSQMVALSDRGFWVIGDLVRKNGVISAVENVQMSRVLSPDGGFAKHTGWRDSEGLAQLEDGSFVVSFEAEHRLEAFPMPGALPQNMPWPTNLGAMPLNGGFEALAVDDSGVLFAMPETAIGVEDEIQVFALDTGKWTRAFTLPRNKQFQPVGADFGHDGRLYVLERGFNGLGFRTRVRSFDISNGIAGDEKVLFNKGIGRHDNLEGISVWRDAAGLIRLTMISDDNFRFLQQTEIVEYVLPNPS